MLLKQKRAFAKKISRRLKYKRVKIVWETILKSSRFQVSPPGDRQTETVVAATIPAVVDVQTLVAKEADVDVIAVQDEAGCPGVNSTKQVNVSDCFVGCDCPSEFSRIRYGFNIGNQELLFFPVFGS